ncbi:MAG: hypothetical protein K6F05_03685 [Succinivibrio sp.]|nr:hypothetical protein [Succinivibrio sp.]
MSINNSSAIILIIGAIAVLAFIIHALWFSGRSVNRKLVKNNQLDQEIIKSSAVGKVRIVTTERNDQGQGVQVETFELPKEQPEPETNKAQENSAAEEPQPQESKPLADTYELNIVAETDKPYLGDDIKEICNKYGFLRGESDLFYVYEDPVRRDKVVFRICSLKAPYSFPKNLSNYETPALAIYMELPPKGNAFPYFKAMRMAAEIFVERVGGKIQDNNYHDLSAEDLDAISAQLKRYDETAE